MSAIKIIIVLVYHFQNLLSKEFDYSDEDDSGDDDFNRKLEVEAKLAELTKQQIIGF